MADIDGLIELAQAPFIPLTPQALRELIEGFPEFWRLLAEHLRSLAGYADGELPGLTGTAEGIADMAAAAGAAQDAAEQAALAFAQEAEFWLGALPADW